MRAIAYLSHVLTIRQQAPTASVTVAPHPTPSVGVSPAPDNATCVAGHGTPGSVYICGAPGDCEYWGYSKKSKDCQVLGKTFKNPTLVGPDYGGYCHLYKTTTCADGDEIQLIAGIATAPLPVPDKPSKIMCPGIREENVPPDAAVAIKCVDSLTHPTQSGAAPVNSTVSTPATPVNAAPGTAPSGCPTDPNAASLLHSLAQNATPVPEPCKCANGNGRPGAVYLCKNVVTDTAKDCKWLDHDIVKGCAPLKSLIGIDFSNPSFLGPDYNGHCHLYNSLTCEDADEIALFTDAQGAPSKKFVCPGVNLPFKPANGQTVAGLGDLSKAMAIKCIDSMTHPGGMAAPPVATTVPALTTAPVATSKPAA